MPWFVNHNGYPVYLPGPDGKTVPLQPRERKLLHKFFEKYIKLGLIKAVEETVDKNKHISPRANIRLAKPKQEVKPPVPIKPQDIKKLHRQIAKKHTTVTSINKSLPAKQVVAAGERKRLGRPINEDGMRIYNEYTRDYYYPISNNIGVGILSYNRRACLERLVKSIINHTDLSRTTVFISDDCSDKEEVQDYLHELSLTGNFVVLRNESRLGIAGNTNRLLRCLSRFKYGLLLNDDVEVQSQGWEYFYPKVMEATKLEHLIHRQEGVYGAEKGEKAKINNVALYQVDSKPQGAILAFTQRMLKTVGYFDESFGLYGMEHVDWSYRASEFGIQPRGFFDAEGSDKYFYLYPEKSAVEDRTALLKQAREKFNTRQTKRYVEASIQSAVPSISYVVPFRNTDRTKAIETVVSNIRGQRFPFIDIILSEHDIETRVDLIDLLPVTYIRCKCSSTDLFNKSLAFNQGATKVNTESLIMHDADILLRADYTSTIYNLLKIYDACHIGKTVIYADEASTSAVINKRKVSSGDLAINRVVGYYEGGSLACKLKTYWGVGGFNEDFKGYGCEDCDFFSRLASVDKWMNTRTEHLLHLHHGRVPGWDSHHQNNKAIEAVLSQKPMMHRISLQIDQLKRLGYGNYLK